MVQMVLMMMMMVVMEEEEEKEDKEKKKFLKIIASQLLSVHVFYPRQLIRIRYLSGSAAAIVPFPPTKGLPGNIDLSSFSPS